MLSRIFGWRKTEYGWEKRINAALYELSGEKTVGVRVKTLRAGILRGNEHWYSLGGVLCLQLGQKSTARTTYSPNTVYTKKLISINKGVPTFT